MNRREIMKRSAAQEATEWEDEEAEDSETPVGSPDQLAEMSQKLRELDAVQGRMEARLNKLMPSAKEAEARLANVVLAGKELKDEIAEHRNAIAASLKDYSAAVAKAGKEIEDQFQLQVRVLRKFLELAEEKGNKNETLVARCQDMVTTSGAFYHRGSAAVQEVSKQTQAHLKATAEAHRREIEAQAQHFRRVYKHLIWLIVVGAVTIFLSALAAGAMAARMWPDGVESRAPGPTHSNFTPPTHR